MFFVLSFKINVYFPVFSIKYLYHVLTVQLGSVFISVTLLRSNHGFLETNIWSSLGQRILYKSVGWRETEKVKNIRVFLLRSDRILFPDNRGVTLHNYAFRPLVIDLTPTVRGTQWKPHVRLKFRQTNRFKGAFISTLRPWLVLKFTDFRNTCIFI